MALKNKRYILIILIVAAAYNSIYSLAFMKGLYYTIMRVGLHLTHFQLGQLYSAYGIFSMVSYLCGAFFVSCFPHWKLITVTSLAVGVLTLYLYTIPSYIVTLLLFGVIGFLIGAAFYPAHLEVLHQLGALESQGAVFGLFFVFNSIFGILFAGTGMGITSLHFTDEERVKMLFLFFAILNIAAGILSFLFLRRVPANEGKRSALSFSSIKELFGNKRLWLVILIVFTNYLAYTNMNYILPFLTQRFCLPASVNNILSIVRVYLIGIAAAPLAGRITDRLHSASKLLGITFFLHFISIVVMVFLFHDSTIGTIVCVLMICFFATMGKSMALVTVDEMNLPPYIYGLCISFISFVAYSPDAFYYFMSGWILDAFPERGYDYIFLIAAAISLIGIGFVVKLNHMKSQNS